MAMRKIEGTKNIMVLFLTSSLYFSSSKSSLKSSVVELLTSMVLREGDNRSFLTDRQLDSQKGTVNELCGGSDPCGELAWFRVISGIQRIQS